MFVYLDNDHVVSPPDRTRGAYNVLGEQLSAAAGIQVHTGKTRVWNCGGTCPLDVVDLGECQDFGTQIGSPEFVHSTVQAEVRREGRLWEHDDGMLQVMDVLMGGLTGTDHAR